MKEVSLKIYILQAQIYLELEVVKKKHNVQSWSCVDDHGQLLWKLRFRGLMVTELSDSFPGVTLLHFILLPHFFFGTLSSSSAVWKRNGSVRMDHKMSRTAIIVCLIRTFNKSLQNCICSSCYKSVTL